MCSMDLERNEVGENEYQTPSIDFLAADTINDGVETPSLVVAIGAFVMVHVSVLWNLAAVLQAGLAIVYDVAVKANHSAKK